MPRLRCRFLVGGVGGAGGVVRLETVEHVVNFVLGGSKVRETHEAGAESTMPSSRWLHDDPVHKAFVADIPLRAPGR